jgi:hypothetical protein
MIGYHVGNRIGLIKRYPNFQIDLFLDSIYAIQVTNIVKKHFNSRVITYYKEHVYEAPLLEIIDMIYETVEQLEGRTRRSKCSLL